MPRQKQTRPEEALAQFFLKSVGVECGLYNAHSETFTEGFESESLYWSNIECAKYALKSGYTFDEVRFMIGDAYKNGIREALLSSIIPEKKKEEINEGANLLELDKQYYHSALFTHIAPTFAVSDTVMIPVSRGSITRKDTFTLSDLMTYFYNSISIGCIARRREAHMKTMSYVLTQMTLDEALFCIDAAALENKYVSVVELMNFLPEAQRELSYFKSRSE